MLVRPFLRGIAGSLRSDSIHPGQVKIGNRSGINSVELGITGPHHGTQYRTLVPLYAAHFRHECVFFVVFIPILGVLPPGWEKSCGTRGCGIVPR